MPNQPRPSLPADSLALSLCLAARAVSGVLAGKSLADTLPDTTRFPLATRAAAQELAYGTLRRYRWSELLLAALLHKPLTQPLIHALLLCALYRLESRPDATHTLVNQSVEAAAALAQDKFRALVNGLLRNYLRHRPKYLQALTNDEAQHWHPHWWLNRLRQHYPQDWQNIVAIGNSPPPMTLRVNQRRNKRDTYLQTLMASNIAASACGLSGIRLEHPQAVSTLPGFTAGAVSVQDLGAQEALRYWQFSPGMRVLDACAAPGGKTAHLLEENDLRLLALDISPARVERIRDNLTRLGLSAEVKVADCCQVQSWWDGHLFDRILADVPCSASGVVRRHPDSKWLRRDSDIANFACKQHQILKALWPTLASGGQMLYATCSVFPEENQQQIQHFLSTHPQAQLCAEQQLLPQRDHDGFYYALLQKTA